MSIGFFHSFLNFSSYFLLKRKNINYEYFLTKNPPTITKIIKVNKNQDRVSILLNN